ncbi:hypothetical protein IDJ77_04110 [Mucilaginibacter sp. ZT4R22]|uniref:Uncharacterized protein n=1 Tax=Mucilaginibacter pankratovii TaxID=2772110 RepID=A0ABR7WKY6_9SPHI|nr:hypothetical protein [Mucilaginibacter pankratovii]MBD1362986.1 hypothetical protein [Mucilaginibacter pankratovii]
MLMGFKKEIYEYQWYHHKGVLNIPYGDPAAGLFIVSAAQDAIAIPIAGT